MSKFTKKLQTMSLGTCSKTQKREDEWTTVENNKSGRKPSKITFADNKPRTGGSAAASIYSLKGPAGNRNHRKSDRSQDVNLMSMIDEDVSPPSAHEDTHIALPHAKTASRMSAMTSKNWRDREAKFDEQSSIERREYKREWYRPGLIIRAKLHEEMFLGGESTMTADVAAKSITVTSHGKIITKDRVMIVVDCFDNHYIVVPLFTHRGQGLQNKNADEYISVRDHRDQSSNFQALSKNGKLTTEFMQPGIKQLDPKSTAHVTYHLSRRYDFPIVYEGYLNDYSTNRLIRLYNSYTPKEVAIKG